MTTRKPKLELARPTTKRAMESAPTSAAARAAAKLEEGDARLVVNLSAATHQEIRLRAVERRITIREYVLGLLRADGIDAR